MNAARGRLGVLVRSFPKLSETFILGEILGLERAGFSVTIFTLRPPTDAIAQPLVAQVRADIVALEPPAAAADPDAELARRLATQLQRRGIAHLHAHFIDRPGAIAARAARLADVTFSLSAHAKDIYLGDPRQIRRLLGEARFTVTCTGYNHEVLERLAPPGAAVHRVYHGIDTHHFAPRSTPKGSFKGDATLSAEGGAALRPCSPEVAPAAVRPARILAVGRLREKKGFATLVRACATLRQQGVDCLCDIVGYGEQQAALEALIDAHGLASRVRLQGKMNHDQILALYRAADVFAAPSEIAADGDRDGIPNVLLEAMSAGLPVVTTAVSGIPEVIRDGDNGLFVAPGDAAALGAAIARLIHSPALREQLGAAARRTVIAQFGEDRNLGQLVALLEPFTTGAAAPVVAGAGTRRGAAPRTVLPESRSCGAHHE